MNVRHNSGLVLIQHAGCWSENSDFYVIAVLFSSSVSSFCSGLPLLHHPKLKPNKTPQNVNVQK